MCHANAFLPVDRFMKRTGLLPCLPMSLVREIGTIAAPFKEARALLQNVLPAAAVACSWVSYC
jgi:hypothetical protein